jgi:hypothetical protein
VVVGVAGGVGVGLGGAEGNALPPAGGVGNGDGVPFCWVCGVVVGVGVGVGLGTGANCLVPAGGVGVGDGALFC